MFSSIFKSLTIGAFLFAPHTSAEIANWDINFLQLLPDFSRDVTSEITLKYEIGTGRASHEVNAFQKGCIEPITDITVSILKSIASKDANHDSLDVFLDLDKSSLFGSEIWNPSSNKLELCVRVDLLSGLSGVVKTDERDVNVEINFDVDFSTDVNLAKNTIEGMVGTLEVYFTASMTLMPGTAETVESAVDDTEIVVDDTELDNTVALLENVMQDIPPTSGSIQLTSFGDVSLTRRMLRYLQEGTNIEYEIIFSEWCDGTNDCVTPALQSAEDFSVALNADVGDGSFSTSINEQATQEGIQDLQSVYVDPDSLVISEFQIRFIAFVNQTARVENYVQACICDNPDSFTCNTATLNPDSLLNVCIKSTSGEMEIDSLDNLKMTQGTEELIIVKTNTLEDSSISSKTMVPAKNGVHVATVIPSKFFSYDSINTATITGLVYIKLAGSRRLAVEITGYPEVQATGSTRALAETLGNQESTFAINVELEKRKTETNNGATTASVMSGFIVAFSVAAILM
jgi:hypothetical protein